MNAYAATATYIYMLQNENEYLYSIRETQTSTDFGPTVIAREEISVFRGYREEKPEHVYTIKSWERCAIGVEHKEYKPPRVEIECRAGFGWIEKDQKINLILTDRQVPQL